MCLHRLIKNILYCVFDFLYMIMTIPGDPYFDLFVYVIFNTSFLSAIDLDKLEKKGQKILFYITFAMEFVLDL